MKKLVAFLIAAAVLAAPPVAFAAKKEAGEKSDKDGDAKKEGGGKKKEGAKKKEAKKEGGAVGYGGAKVQMSPMMAPYRTSGGISFEVITVRLVLDAGPRERPACFSIPIVHDHIIQYLFKANLTADDFVGEKRDLLAKNIFDVAVEATGRGFYSSAELVGPDSPELDNTSQTLSTQCK